MAIKDDFFLALLLNVPLTFLISFVQIAYESKVYQIKSMLTIAYTFYLLLLMTGHSFTIMLVMNSMKDENTLNTVPSLWYTLLGVFGFQALIQQVNLSFFDQEVLSFNDWLRKSRGTAIAATIEKHVDLKIERAQELACKLEEKLDKRELHTFANHHLKKTAYQYALHFASSSSNINVEQYLVQLLVEKVPGVVKARIKVD